MVRVGIAAPPPGDIHGNCTRYIGSVHARSPMDASMNTTNTPSTPGECPFPRGRTPSLMFSDGLYEGLAAARRAQPVFYSEEIGHWIITRYTDVLRVLQDTGRFSARNAAVPVTPLHADARLILTEGGFSPDTTVASIDPPHHTRLRT